MKPNSNGIQRKAIPALTGNSSLAVGAIWAASMTSAWTRAASPWQILRTSGTPFSHAGDYGIYAVFEQKLFRVKGDDDRGIGVFARASYSPPDRNLIDVYADGGVEFIGLSDARPHDKLGLAAAYARVSPWTQALDRDFRSLYGPTWADPDV